MSVAHTPDLEQHESASPDVADGPAKADLRKFVDDLLDLTDRRRVLIAAVFGVDVNPQEIDLVFAPADD
ncbi:MAG: hypothetical protein U5K30_17740 [Acidimicrobiales bacterium]|nr:hypothetical protein [Acidimicrobiales bacterium]